MAKTEQQPLIADSLWTTPPHPPTATNYPPQWWPLRNSWKGSERQREKGGHSGRRRQGGHSGQGTDREQRRPGAVKGSGRVSGNFGGNRLCRI
ncbi:hypothetical protein niasHS_001215 [Heterodera schachtii]|uniref:Uncharacterized protein n=1 Tax=Heterodera schachtii TaxID=97005 RepID=A0ABD2KIN4_HETSC